MIATINYMTIFYKKNTIIHSSAPLPSAYSPKPYIELGYAHGHWIFCLFSWEDLTMGCKMNI